MTEMEIINFFWGLVYIITIGFVLMITLGPLLMRILEWVWDKIQKRQADIAADKAAAKARAPYEGHDIIFKPGVNHEEEK